VTTKNALQNVLTGEENISSASPIKIAVASGKGGTGKTTVSVNLYHFVNTHWRDAFLVDCDVEEPNVALFFNKTKTKQQKKVYQNVPRIDTSVCTFCKACAEWCEFNAIAVVASLNFAEVNEDLCHSCGACLHACKFDAIKEFKQPLGVVTQFNAGYKKGIYEGRLKIGSAMQTMMIQQLKKEIPVHSEIIIYDAPPGTSCPVVETVSDTDFVILVTEPTPFGLHDLKIAVELVKKLKKPFGVIVNKAGIGDSNIYNYLQENNIELLIEIPFSQNYSAKYAKGELLNIIDKKTAGVYLELIEKLKQKFHNWQRKLPYSAGRAVPEKL